MSDTGVITQEPTDFKHLPNRSPSTTIDRSTMTNEPFHPNSLPVAKSPRIYRKKKYFMQLPRKAFQEDKPTTSKKERTVPITVCIVAEKSDCLFSTEMLSDSTN
ncbi:hypothetical protein EIN_132460 [Entamoeba invadens IP1]|uniref:Uncharacterized protein n=1 Tax=Entamoeba invadens IP1 TaxID=370355 RepID=A0A0A1UD47_ENTIV|nr:hypothetical protein EIN_132460 [Entamoeba invadens IP1]ELP94357.1 hypothetical protein EIN_132460 [Entamoeba invadens IP1]|eukprot:XP_004261128.1 hypothetical protein EIN_132460 [Entamoeba invadens IP1]